MKKYHGKTLDEWKKYIKEDGRIGIRTQKYILVLEEELSKLQQPTVSSSGKCSKCEVNDAQLEHTCPYSEEINDDSDSLCDCCSDCEYQCCMDI